MKQFVAFIFVIFLCAVCYIVGRCETDAEMRGNLERDGQFRRAVITAEIENRKLSGMDKVFDEIRHSFGKRSARSSSAYWDEELRLTRLERDAAVARIRQAKEQP